MFFEYILDYLHYSSLAPKASLTLAIILGTLIGSLGVQMMRNHNRVLHWAGSVACSLAAAAIYVVAMNKFAQNEFEIDQYYVSLQLILVSGFVAGYFTPFARRLSLGLILGYQLVTMLVAYYPLPSSTNDRVSILLPVSFGLLSLYTPFSSRVTNKVLGAGLITDQWVVIAIMVLSLFNKEFPHPDQIVQIKQLSYLSIVLLSLGQFLFGALLISLGLLGMLFYSVTRWFYLAIKKVQIRYTKQRQLDEEEAIGSEESEALISSAPSNAGQTPAVGSA